MPLCAYDKREVKYEFYGLDACNSRTVWIYRLFRRLVVLVQKVSFKTFMKTKRTYRYDMFFCFGTPIGNRAAWPMQLTRTTQARIFFVFARLFDRSALARRGGRTIHWIVR